MWPIGPSTWSLSKPIDPLPTLKASHHSIRVAKIYLKGCYSKNIVAGVEKKLVVRKFAPTLEINLKMENLDLKYENPL